MDGYFCLKWNNHSSTFLHSLRIIHEENLYCDATIACQGQYYPVHKFVLATCSDYFKDIFKEVVCKHPFIILKDIDPKDLEALLDYMYKGEVNVIQETILGLMEAADSLKIKGLAVPDELNSSRSTCGSKSTHSNRELKRSLTPTSPLSPTFQNSLLDKENIHKKAKISSDTDLEENGLSTPFSLLQPDIQNGSFKQKENIPTSPLKICEDHTEEIEIKEEPQEDIPKNQQSIRCQSSTIETQLKTEPSELPKDEDSFDDNSVNFFNSKSSANGVDTPNFWDDVCFPESHHSIFRTDLQQNTFLNLPPQCSSWNVDENTEFANSPLDIHSQNQVVNRQKSRRERGYETAGRLLKKILPISGNVYQRLQCGSCQYKCKKEISMQKHKISKHFNDTPEINPGDSEKNQKELMCCYCSYTTIQPSRLKSHMSIHTGYKPYSCTYCSYKSSQSGTMKRHIQNVHKDKFS